MISASNIALAYGKRVIFKDVNIKFTPGERIAMLRQDQFAFDDETVCNTVIMGHKRLFKVMAEREALYLRQRGVQRGRRHPLRRAGD